MRVFVAGGTGAVGRHLIPSLVADGHQMTSLGITKDFRRFDEEFAVTNELRTRGTDYLPAAVLHRLRDDRQRQRCRGHRPGGIRPAGPGPSQGNPGERAEGVPCDDGHPTGCVVNPDKLRRLGRVSELARKPPPKTRQPFIPARIARSPRRDQARGHAAR